MPKVRSEMSPNNKWWISKHRFLELYHYCLQYKEWKDEYESLDGKKSINYDGMPHGTNTGDPTYDLAVRRVELKNKIQMVQMTSHETDIALQKYILEGVTNENATFEYLYFKMGMPCSRNTYYERRKKFYWLLDKHLNKK